MAILYIVATPIGNLQDITIRALETLNEVDLILCEDTRVTRKLLAHYSIKTPTLSYHQHSRLKKVEHIFELLKSGKNLALVSDAGTPGISDPGNKLISEITKQSSIKIVPIPGCSAVTAAASISGFPMDRFVFLGFPPTKKKRQKFFEEVLQSKYPVILYESPHRIVKSLRDLHKFAQMEAPNQNKFGTGQARIDTNRKVVVCRELTKKFETVYRGTISEVIEQISHDKIKGEFTVIVGGK